MVKPQKDLGWLSHSHEAQTTSLATRQRLATLMVWGRRTVSPGRGDMNAVDYPWHSGLPCPHGVPAESKGDSITVDYGPSH